MDTYVVKRLEQAKLLTDPFKLKLLERFGGKPVTTKQVADRMGEKAPRLYRHVDALVDEGLLELVEEKPKRGTIERYYRTVASRFEVDPGLFSTSSGVGDDAVNMLRGMLRDTESDLVTLFDKYKDAEQDPDALPIVMRLAIRGTPDEIRRLRQKLDEWMDDCKSLSSEPDDAPDMLSYSGLLAFYPRPDDE
jgi:DNA-binding transcriptional ArsR family regulator